MQNQAMGVFNDRFRRAAKESGLSFAEIGRQVGRTRQAVGGWAKEGEPELEIIRQLAVILKRDPGWLAPHLMRHTISVEGLPVHGKVAAGVWHEVVDNQDPNVSMVPVAPDRNYPLDAQYVLQVEGNSVNKWARHGAYVTCVDCKSGAVSPRPGDLVVVERRRGGLVETTIKRLENVNGALELHPVSDDHAYQEKLTLGHPMGDTTVEIIAVAIWASNPIPRGA